MTYDYYRTPASKGATCLPDIAYPVTNRAPYEINEVLAVACEGRGLYSDTSVRNLDLTISNEDITYSTTGVATRTVTGLRMGGTKTGRSEKGFKVGRLCPSQERGVSECFHIRKIVMDDRKITFDTA